ncbi:hypothetical protein [Kitasatospora cystarginea]|uniref:hypothetical protein n=1 Tax=Kitasatospora cystarginea TaxID=58350 RepID=UPI0031D3E4D3
MTSNQTGPLIGGTFGLIFIQANAGDLPSAIAIPLRALGAAAFLGLLAALRRAPAPRTTGTPQRTFGRGYWLVVAAEVIAAAAGFFVIISVLHAPHATVGWIALVVGVHFFGLAAVWRMAALRLLAAGMSLCGAAGLVLAACGSSPAVIAAVAGIAPGALLLASVWRSALAKPALQDTPA